MPKSERIRCACGGVLSRPIPAQCPHCGASIVGVRRSSWPLLLSILLIGGLFAALAGYLVWLMR